MNMDKTKKTNYKSDSELSLVSLSIPFLFMSLASFAASIINTIVLAIVPNNGVIYAEAVGTASRIFNVLATLCTFIIGGIGVIVAQYVGKKKDEEDIHKAIYTSIFTIIIFTLSIFAFSEIISPFILFGYLKPGSDQYNNGLIYIETIAISLLFMTPKSAIGAIVNSYGYVKHTIIWNILGIFIDTSLTILFVIGIDLGVLGSSLGTIIANFVTLIYAIIILNKKVLKWNWKKLRLDKKIFKKLLKISIPIGFEKISYNFAMLIVGIFIAQIGLKFKGSFYFEEGTNKINLLNVANTIIQTFSTIITITSIAFSQGGAIICARKMGAKDYVGAEKTIKKAFLISLISDVVLSIILFFIQTYLVDFFEITQSDDVKKYFNIVKKIVFIPFLLLIFLQIGRTLNIIYLTGPMSYGNLLYNSIFSVINTWVLLIIFGFVSLYCSSSSNYGDILYGMNGIYLFMTFDELFRGFFNYWWWKSKKWKKKKNGIKNVEQSS